MVAECRWNAGSILSRFQATGNKQTLVVREIVTDRQGQSWSDVSSWYWAALLGKTNGPWLATTVASEIATPSSQANKSEIISLTP